MKSEYQLLYFIHTEIESYMQLIYRRHESQETMTFKELSVQELVRLE